MPETDGLKSFQMDKTAFSIGSLEAESDEKQHWLSKEPMERFYAVEFLRQVVYGYDPATERLQRFFEIAELS